MGFSIPRPSNRCFLEALKYLKTTRKHMLEGLVVLVFLCMSDTCQTRP